MPVPAPTVARRADHSVDVLLRVHANCIDGDDGIASQHPDYLRRPLLRHWAGKFEHARKRGRGGPSTAGFADCGRPATECRGPGLGERPGNLGQRPRPDPGQRDGAVPGGQRKLARPSRRDGLRVHDGPGHRP
jgi:hypothetical protein